MIQKIKKLFSFLKSKGAERGLAIVPVLIVIGILALLGVGIYEIEKFRAFIGDIGYQVAKGLSWVLLPLSQYLAKMACTLLQNVLALDFMAKPITKDPVIIESVKFVRDFANMFIVLGFVVVAIATTLRIMEYGAQKLLFPLIAIAILVNFSSVLCGLFIDVANIFMKYFLDAGAAGVIQQYDFKSGDKNDVEFQAKLKEFMALKDAGTVNFLGLIYGMAFFNFIIFGVFLYLSIMLIVRQTMLMVLVILAPLAFVFFVFGFTKKYFKMWWEQFLAWNFFGVIMLFFAYLAARMIVAGTLAGGPEVGEVNLLGFFVPMIFLLIGYKISRATAGFGADAAIGLAKGAGLAVISGGAALAGATATRLGSAMKESKTGQAVSDKWTGMKERIGAAPKGAVSQQREERAKKALEPLKAEARQNPQKVSDIAASRRAKPEERAAAVMALAETNPEMLNATQHSRALTDAKAFGFDTRAAYNKKPSLLGAPDQIKAHVGNMSQPQLRGIHKSEWQNPATAAALMGSISKPRFEGLYNAQTPAGKRAIDSTVRSPEGRNQLAKYGRMYHNTHRDEEFRNLMGNYRVVNPRPPRPPKPPTPPPTTP